MTNPTKGALTAAPANDAAVSEARVEAIAREFCNIVIGEGPDEFLKEAKRIIAADPLTASHAALQSQVEFWQSRALSAQAALKALVSDPSFPDVSDAGIEAARQALAAQPVEVSDA